MTALLIILIILLLLFILLCLPVTADLFYEKAFSYCIKYAGFVLLDSEKIIDIKKAKRRKKKWQTKDKTTSETMTEKEDNFFKKTYKQKGFAGAIKYFSELLIMLLKKVWFVVKHLKFTRFKLNITVASDDAANTAIEYGGVCAAVYPVLSFIQTKADFKAQAVNISTDFDKKESVFETSISVTTRLIYFLIIAISALFEFLKLQRKEREKT